MSLINVTEIKVELTRNGPKAYESNKLTATATLHEGASALDALNELTGVVLAANNDVDVSSNPTVVTSTKVTQRKPETTIIAKPKFEKPVPAPVKLEGEKVEEVKENKEEVEATPAKETKATKAKAALAKSKNTPYDRTLDTHKKLLSSFLDNDFPEWKQPKNLAKAGKASTELAGTDYLDAEGIIIPQFKESFLNYLRAY
jgi:hypothetical protein